MELWPFCRNKMFSWNTAQQQQPVTAQTVTVQSQLSHKPRQPQPIQSQPRQSQPIQLQPRQSQPIQSQPRQSQPIQSQPRRLQPRQSQPRQSQPRLSAQSQRACVSFNQRHWGCCLLTGLRSQWIIFSRWSTFRHCSREKAKRRMSAIVKPWKLFFLISSYRFMLQHQNHHNQFVRVHIATPESSQSGRTGLCCKTRIITIRSYGFMLQNKNHHNQLERTSAQWPSQSTRPY